MVQTHFVKPHPYPFSKGEGEATSRNLPDGSQGTPTKAELEKLKVKILAFLDTHIVRLLQCRLHTMALQHFAMTGIIFNV